MHARALAIPFLAWTLILCPSKGELFAQNPQPAAQVIGLQGRVETHLTDWAAAQLDQVLVEGQGVRTFRRSRAVLLLADETQFKMNANSELQLQQVRATSSFLTRISQAAAQSGQTILNLRQGQIYLRSRKRPTRVQVNTPSVTAAIRGTEFDLDVAPDGTSVVTVLTGIVDFRNDFGSIVVNSGEQGTARVGQPPTKTVILNPENAVQWSYFYSASVSSRDYPFETRSAAEAQRLLASGPSSPLETARLLFDAGQPERALETLQGVSGQEAAAIRGWLHLARQEIENAFSAFRLADASSVRTRLGLSLCYLAQDNVESAYQQVEDPGDFSLLKVQKAALLLLFGDAVAGRDLLESIPSDSHQAGLAKALLSNALLVQNQPEKALMQAREALAAGQSSPSAHLSLSLAYQAQFDLDAALEEAERALEIDPGFIPALVQYAKLLFGLGRTARAEEMVISGRRIAPQEAHLEAVFGFVLLARGKTEEAARSFQVALARDPVLADARLGLGLVALRRGQPAQAAEQILTAAALEPRLSIYQSYLAKAFYELRELEQAFSALLAARELDPRDPTPHLYSGIFLEDQNQPGEAVSSFQESIRLNDFRAVYRSRYLLDQDQAVRNINLAQAYNRLGLSEWANSEALKSVITSPANSSARLFLADTFLNLDGRTQAGGSELLLARLLMPVNLNSFNTFNDYTTMFELPRVFWTAGAAAGNHSSSEALLISTGGTSRIGYSSIFSFDQTDGFRPRNDDAESYSSVNILKWALTPESDLLFSYSNQQNDRGGLTAVPLVSRENDPDLRIFTRIQRAEVGYHRRLRPGSEVALLFTAREVEQVIDDPNALTRLGIDIQLRRSSREPNLGLQAIHFLKLPQVELRYGLDIFEGRRRQRDVFIFSPPGSDQVVSQEFDLLREKVRFKTVFFRADYPVNRRFRLSAGLNYDWASDDNRLDSRQDSTNRWNPQAGVFFNPLPQTLLRFAFTQNLQTHFQERVVPVHLYGFPIGQNESALTHSTSYNAGWDQYAGENSFFRVTSFWRTRHIPSLSTLQLPFGFQGESYGGRFSWNQILTPEWTLVPEYSLTHSKETNLIRHDHEIRAGLFFVHPSGFTLRLEESYFRQTGRLGLVNRRTKVFTTNLRLLFEMPRKLGLLFFDARNLFDREFEFLTDPLEVEPRTPDRQIRAGIQIFF